MVPKKTTLGFFAEFVRDGQVILGTVSLGPPDPRIASDAFLGGNDRLFCEVHVPFFGEALLNITGLGAENDDNGLV